jgi:hypothetical protein
MTSTQVSPRDPYGPHADSGNGRVKTTEPGRDWRLIRAAEANAREIGMRASIPDPAAAGTPEYTADLAQWGDGRGISPDGPETGAGVEAGE